MTALARFSLMCALAKGRTRREFDAAPAKVLPGYTVQQIFREAGR